MRIGIDIDGVLTDLEQWQLDVGSKFFTKYNKPIIKYDGYEISEIFDVSENMDNIFWEENIYEYVTEEPPRKFSAEVIQKLKSEGHEIYIITARYLTNKENEQGFTMRNIVKNWLKENHISYDKIIFSPEDKLEICIENDIDVMIEDKVDNINKISSTIPVICFHASYNANCKGENIFRAYSWYGVYSKIQQINNNSL